MKVIAEFDKPKSCETCPCFYQTEGAFCDICQLTNTEIKDYFIVDKSCPLKEKNEWHDLRKNPNDLPKENMKQVIVGLSDGSYQMGYYCIHNNSWWATNDCPDYDDELYYYDCNTGEKIYPIKWKEIKE